jgi:thiosulfate/3-mercaptopyruvate sulfurtransferase
MKIHIIIVLLAIFVKIGHSTPIVDAKWLSKNTCKDNIKIIEVGVSFNSYIVEHVKCAKYTNFYNDGWRVVKDGASMVLPSSDDIVKIVTSLEIENKDHIVLYAKKNTIYGMAEVTAIYFTFKYLGHENISILNGGYPDFKKTESLFVEEGEYDKKITSKYVYKLNNIILANSEDIINNQKNNLPIVDSREADFFLGINKLRSFEKFGTIEKSINIPSKWFLESRGLNFNNKNKINKIFSQVGLPEKEDVIFFCYAGLESSLNWFVSHELMKNSKAKLYEGSIFKWNNEKKKLN